MDRLDPINLSQLPDVGDLYVDGCLCRDILNLIGAKWPALIIGRLETDNHRFGELKRAIPGISQRSLTQALRRLERDGLVDRRVHTDKRPPQVDYSLTELGQSSTDPLKAIRRWSEQHLHDVAAARNRFDERTTPET